jgi:hypothetical protein
MNFPAGKKNGRTVYTRKRHNINFAVPPSGTLSLRTLCIPCNPALFRTISALHSAICIQMASPRRTFQTPILSAPLFLSVRVKSSVLSPFTSVLIFTPPIYEIQRNDVKYSSQASELLQPSYLHPSDPRLTKRLTPVYTPSTMRPQTRPTRLLITFLPPFPSIRVNLCYLWSPLSVPSIRPLCPLCHLFMPSNRQALPKTLGHSHKFNPPPPKSPAIQTVPLCSVLFRQKKISALSVSSCSITPRSAIRIRNLH